jgi:hypothetical protein
LKVIELWAYTLCNTQVVKKELKILHFIMSATDAEVLEQDKEKTPSPRKAKLFKCGHHLCPGPLLQLNQSHHPIEFLYINAGVKDIIRVCNNDVSLSFKTSKHLLI